MATRYTKEEAIKRIKAGLHCGDEEAEEVYNYDQKIEHSDEKDKQEYDLTGEQEKIAKKVAKAGTRKPTVYQFKTRERKKNATKEGIISEIAQFLQENSGFSTEKVEITNKERQIAFEINGERYELTLVKNRKPKK